MKQNLKSMFASFLGGLGVTLGSLSAYEIYHTAKNPVKRAQIRNKIDEVKAKLNKD